MSRMDLAVAPPPSPMRKQHGRIGEQSSAPPSSETAIALRSLPSSCRHSASIAGHTYCPSQGPVYYYSHDYHYLRATSYFLSAPTTHVSSCSWWLPSPHRGRAGYPLLHCPLLPSAAAGLPTAQIAERNAPVSPLVNQPLWKECIQGPLLLIPGMRNGDAFHLN